MSGNLLYETKQGLQAVVFKSGATFASDTTAKWQGFAKKETLPQIVVYGGGSA